MPYRTKDFLLFMVAVTFILLGITGTIASDLARPGGAQSASLISTFSDDIDYGAEATVSESSLNRDRRLSDLRVAVENKLREQSVIKQSTTISSVPEASVLTESTSVVVQSGPLLCEDYRSEIITWSAQGLRFEIEEGARLLTRGGAVSYQVDDVTGEMTDVFKRDVIMQLPLPYSPARVMTCLASDVVGIALDGSLIRNNEASLYGLFSDSTLVGYALDGFPIFGQYGGKLDQCGGQSRNGNYGYYLSRDRGVVLNCFSGAPVSLP